MSYHTSYEDKIGGFCDANEAMDLQDLIEGVCRHAARADDEIAELKLKYEGLQDNLRESVKYLRESIKYFDDPGLNYTLSDLLDDVRDLAK